jgi:ACS family hexuronate transporter-like MFS transporter
MQNQNRPFDKMTQSVAQKIGRFRWSIAAMLFFALTINYMDRFVLGILSPELLKLFHWSEADYTDIMFFFEIAYAIGLVTFGRVLDWLGTRKGFLAAIILWSLACAGHALVAKPAGAPWLFASTIIGFGAMRFLLGIGESGVFPAAVKTTAEWFPRKERGLVAGIFNSGSTVGSIAAPLLIPWIFHAFGWQMSFVLTGAVGFVWVGVWMIIYQTPRESRFVSAAEVAHIEQDPPEPVSKRIPWLTLLKLRQTWSFIVAKFMTDAAWRWYFYLLPLFFNQKFGLNIKDFGLHFVIIYMTAGVGGIFAGYISDFMLGRGLSINAARKLALLICSLCTVPVAFAGVVSNEWMAVGLVAVAAAAHQGFSSNIFTTVSDMFPKNAVASVVGLGGTAGCFGAMGLLALTKYLFQHVGASGGNSGVYQVLFIIAGSCYVVSLLCFHLLVPKMKPVSPEQVE